MVRGHGKSSQKPSETNKIRLGGWEFSKKSHFGLQMVFCIHVGLIVHSLIPGHQTFSDFFYILKFCEETVCAINVVYFYFLKMCLVWEYWKNNKSYECESKKNVTWRFCPFSPWNGRMTCQKNLCRFLPLATVIHFYFGADLISVISVQAFFTEIKSLPKF